MAGSDLVFFDSTTNEIVTCSVSDCLVKRVLAKSVSPSRIVADAMVVYWTETSNGTVRGVAR
jgi:hypothetical protein